MFLYKLAEGSCPKSYGFNAAKLAGLPGEIIVKAHEIARGLERKARNRQIIYNLVRADDRSAVIKALKSLKV